MCHTINMKKEIPLTYAVQPRSWINFDAHGCLWALDVEDARRLARSLGERAILWVAPPKGEAYALCYL